MFLITLKLKEMFKNAVKNFLFVIKYVPDSRLRKIAIIFFLKNDGMLWVISYGYGNKKNVSGESFMLKYCVHMTQKMCDKAVDAYLSVLNLKFVPEFVPDWLVVTEMLDNAISLMMIHTLMIYFLILLHPLARIWVLLL